MRRREKASSALAVAMLEDEVLRSREAGEETIALLRQLGFNRMSLGVQDFEPAVQQAVNRIQTEAETLAVLEAARAEINGGRSLMADPLFQKRISDVEIDLMAIPQMLSSHLSLYLAEAGANEAFYRIRSSIMNDPSFSTNS